MSAKRKSVAARQGFEEAVRPRSIGQIVTGLPSRTAVVRVRMRGGVTGKAREGPPMSIQTAIHRAVASMPGVFKYGGFSHAPCSFNKVFS